MLQLRCRAPQFNAAAPNLAAFGGGARTAPSDMRDPLLWMRAPTVPALGLPVPPEVLLAAREAGPAGRAYRTFAALAVAGGLLGAPVVGHAEEDETAEEASDEPSPEGAEQPVSEALPPEPPIIVSPAVVGPHPLSYEGDALWKAVRGAKVEVTLKGNKVIQGTVLTQAGDEIAIAREPDGTVARVPKHLVRRLRVIGMAGAGGGLEETERPMDGKGPAIAGAILTIMGTSFMTTSAVISLAGGYYYGLPLFFLGTSMLGPGIPLLAAGIEQQVKFAEWEEANDLRLGFGVSPKGVSAGLSFRF